MQAAKHNQFHGLSILRAEEKAKKPKSEQAKALQTYLKKYSDPDGTGLEPKKKKRRKAALTGSGVRIIDEDSTGFAVLAAKKIKYDPQAEDEEDDAPVIANPGEAELYARLKEKEKSGAAFQNWASVGESQDTVSPHRGERHDSPDRSPPRRGRHDNPDASPPQRRRHDSPDASPPRRPRQDSPDALPPRRGQNPGSDSDISPARRRQPRQPSPDTSAPRRTASKKAEKKAIVMSDGTISGMVSGQALAAEMEKKRAAERQRFAKLEAASGSRHAETVYRDKETGKRMTREEFESAQKVAAEKKKPKYETPEWGAGVRQMREQQEQAEALRAEAAKPFARSLADVDEELNLRDRVRFGDPMAHLVKQRASAPPPPSIPPQLAKQMKKSGFVVPQDVPPHSWLNRKMGPPANRYGIRPGRHWDGVDRSTGFEREMFKQQAARAALEREARMWAQADM